MFIKKGSVLPKKYLLENLKTNNLFLSPKLPQQDLKNNYITYSFQPFLDDWIFIHKDQESIAKLEKDKAMISETKNENNKKKKIRHEKKVGISDLFKNLDLMAILEKIPGLDLNMSKEQINAINSTNEVTMISGRSGTGKSTIALLRMVALDLLYIAKKSINKGLVEIKSSEIKRKLFINKPPVKGKFLLLPINTSLLK